jgi:hypothetical protein
VAEDLIMNVVAFMKAFEVPVPILRDPVLDIRELPEINVPVMAALPTAVFEFVVTAVFEITVINWLVFANH